MKKILALMLTVIMIVGIFALPVMAEESVTVLDENFGKVKVQGKVQSNNSVAFAVRSSFGDSETKDIVQYFISPRGMREDSGTPQNQAFDFYSYQELVSKTSSTVFGSGTKGGGDERTPISLSGFGWIGAGHGMTCAVVVIGEHGLTYKNIGDIYKDKDGVEWVLLAVTEVKDGTMKPGLVFISKNLKSGKTEANPGFYSLADAHIGTDLVNVNDENNKVTINKYKNSGWLTPAYNMTKQNVYVVNGDERTLVKEDGTIHEGEYVFVEEEYTIMNPAGIAAAIIANRPEGGYTENPNLAVGKPLVTFDLEYIYNADGTVISNWETTYHQDVTLGEFGGIQYGAKGDYVYLPNTKPFVMNSSVSINGNKVNEDNFAFDFTNLFDTTKGYPNGYATMDTWADVNNAPNRRLDFSKSNGAFDKAFAGGQLPVFDGDPSVRSQKTDRAFYFWNTRKAYHFSVGGSSSSAGINKMYPDMTGVTHKGSAYKTWIEDFDAQGTASFYSVPYFSDGDNSRYMYFDIYKPGVTKKYDLSAYLGTYSISELEKSENIDYEIDWSTGMLTLTSLANNQKSADYLVLKVKYVGESIPAVELKIRALPELYNESVNDKLAEIAEMMENIGEDESEYAQDLIAKYKSLLAQKEAYEQALKDEAANADRVAGLDNRYETVEMNFPHDAFATDNDFAAPGWYGKELANDTTNTLVYKGFNMQAYGTLSQPAKDNNTAYRASEIENTPGITKGEDGRYIFTIDGVPFKLGEIETADGKIGANAAIFRRQLKADGYTGTEPLNTLSSEYKMEGASGITSATYTLNKDGIGSVNLLLSDLYVGGDLGANRFNIVTVKYTDGEKETFNSVFNKGSHKFPDTVFAVPVETFNSIKNSTKVDSIPMAKELTVDSYKALVAKYVDQATADTITAKPSKWEANDVSKAVHAALVADSKYQALLAAAPVAFNTLVADADAEKFEGISSGDAVTLPTKTAQFVPAKRFTTYTNNYATNYMSNTVIPTDPAKTIETVTVSGGLNEAGPAALASGGFYTTNASSVQTGALMLKYNGSNTITVDGTEYVMFIKLTRQCGDSAIYGMTLARAQTWLDRINELNAKIEALNVETTSKAQLAEIKAEINSLLTQNSSIVYIKDFSEAARTKLDNIEEYLKTHFSEEERIVMLSERTYDYIDIDPDVDLFATWQDTADYASFFKSVSGTSTTSFDKVDYTDKNGVATKIFDWIPQTTSDGTPVTGTEAFYSKGLKGRSAAFAGNVLLIESLIAPEGTKSVTAKRIASATNGTNKDYIEGTSVRKDQKKNIDQSHIIERVNEEGYVTIQNGDFKHKVGPLKADVVSPNARSTVMGDATVLTDAKGTSLDLMVITNNVNSAYYTSKKLGVYATEFVKEDGKVVTNLSSSYASPKAGLQEIVITYADGETEKKYMVSVDNSIANYQAWYSDNPVENTIVYAPKYDADGNEIVYDENSFYINSAETDFKYLTKYNVKNDKIKSEMVQPEDIKFVNENIFMSDSGLLAEVVANKQHASSNSSGKYAAVASIPLKDKTLASLKFTRNNGAALNAEHSIQIATDQMNGSKPRERTAALVPVTIEGASDDFVYFAYCGRLGDGTFVVSATVSSAREDLINQANDKILRAETAEEAEEAIVESIDNLYTKYRDLSDEAKAHYEALTKGLGAIRLAQQGAGYKATAFLKEADKDYKLIICAYDADKNLISTKTVDGKTKDSIYYTHLIDTIPGAAEIKVFLWEGFATLKPYAYNVAEIK